MCELEYIPEHLKGDSLIVKAQFLKGELLFFRCDPEKLKHPYDISLIDLSHNRNFNNPEKYKPNDVLWNTNPEKGFEIYSNKSIVQLCLNVAGDNETINLRLTSIKNEDYYVDIILKHKPIDCNIAHSAFEISFNNTVVNWDNWNDTLGVRKGELKGVSKELRNDIRQFLTKMIISKQVSDENFDIIE